MGISLVDFLPLPLPMMLSLGVEQVAYMKPVRMERGIMYAMYHADGRQMDIAATREDAENTIRRHGLLPSAVH